MGWGETTLVRPNTQWMSDFGDRLLFYELWACPHTSDQFILKKGETSIDVVYWRLTGGVWMVFFNSLSGDQTVSVDRTTKVWMWSNTILNMVIKCKKIICKHWGAGDQDILSWFYVSFAFQEVEPEVPQQAAVLSHSDHFSLVDSSEL